MTVGPSLILLLIISTITSCDYPSSELSPYDSLLSFSCDFDNLTMCNMSNEDRFYTPPTFNFTVLNW